MTNNTSTCCMNLFPTLKIEYHSSLTPDEVIERIKSRIQVINVFGFSERSDRTYIGTVGKNNFVIRKQFSIMQVANPVIKGKVENHGNGCKITFLASSVVFFKIFMGMWLSFAAIAGITTTIEAIMEQDFNWGLLIPWAFFAFGYGLMWAGVVFGTDPDDVLIYELLGE